MEHDGHRALSTGHCGTVWPGRLAAALGRPLAAPSANPSGRVSPTNAGQVLRGLGGRLPLILDGGPCEVGVESTIVMPEADRLVLLRAGGVGRAELARATGLPVVDPAGDAVRKVFQRASDPSAPASMVAISACDVTVGVDRNAARPKTMGADRRANQEWPLPDERRF